MEQILEALTNQDLSDKLETERADHRDEFPDKYAIKPLTPNISGEYSISGSHSDEKTKNKELLTRLTCTLKKLDRCEQERDKNWSIDTVCADTEDASSQKRGTLSRNLEENIKGIIQSTQQYITKLNCQLKDLDNADQQVIPFL